MKEFGIFCRRCKITMLEEGLNPDTLSLGYYRITVIEDCPECNPEKYDKIEAEAEAKRKGVPN